MKDLEVRVITRLTAAAILAGVSLVFALALIGGGWLRPERAVDAAIRELVEGAGPHRSTVARLTVSVHWAPARVERGDGGAIELPPAATIGAAKIARAAMNDRTAATLHALGIAQLVQGRTGSAVSALEEAAQIAPDDGAIWADLAAAYHTKAAAAEAAIDVPKGLEASNAAIALGGAAAGPAWFNKALLFERLNLRDPAASAWKQFLLLDGESAWAKEARQRLAAVESERRGDRPSDLQAERDALFDTVLARWGEALTRGNRASAGDTLAEARQHAARISAAAADTLATAAVEAIQSMSPVAARSAALGHTTYAAARARYKQDDFDAAAPLFASAGRQLAAARTPAALMATLHNGIIEYRLRHHPEAIATLSALREEARRLRYWAVAGRASWVEGLALEFLGSSRQASDRYVIAARLLRDAGEHANAAYVDGLLASQLDRLGNPERAWLMWRKSLEETNRDGVLLNASISATRFGWHRTALDLQIAATDAARRAGRITTVADGLRWQAITNARLGRFEDSQQRIAEARAIAADRTGAAWDRLRAEIDVAEAEGGRSPAARISSASRALAYFEASKSAVRLPEILLVRARARLSAGDADGAHADASHGVRAVIDLRQQVGPGIDQLRFADVVRRLVGTLVELEDRRGRLRDAFETVDEARARDVPDAGAPVSIHTLERRVPTNAALLAFVVGDEHSYIWTVRSGTSTASRIAAGRTAVARLVDAAGPPRFESRAARELRRLFFEPALRSLGTGALLIVVPDGPLHTLPIATLPGTRSAYLIEEHPILLTPSARTWLHASSRLPSQATPPSRVFVAGNPRIDADRYGHLPDLPSAAAEARAVAALYGTTPLTGDAVTRAAVFAGLDADVVHFAGHALVNDVNPAESELVVWDPQGPGVSAGQITAGMCHRTRLVVLGACRSSSGPLTRTEGPISLARAFLAAGAPTVVATHWVVDDEATKALLIRFHEAYRATGDAAGSLREAQLQLIRSPDGTLRQPTNWAGFVAFGGTPLRQQ